MQHGLTAFNILLLLVPFVLFALRLSLRVVSVSNHVLRGEYSLPQNGYSTIVYRPPSLRIFTNSSLIRLSSS